MQIFSARAGSGFFPQRAVIISWRAASLTWWAGDATAAWFRAGRLAEGSAYLFLLPPLQLSVLDWEMGLAPDLLRGNTADDISRRKKSQTQPKLHWGIVCLNRRIKKGFTQFIGHQIIPNRYFFL
jgi:hypothetical protein